MGYSASHGQPFGGHSAVAAVFCLLLPGPPATHHTADNTDRLLPSVRAIQPNLTCVAISPERQLGLSRVKAETVPKRDLEQLGDAWAVLELHQVEDVCGHVRIRNQHRGDGMATAAHNACGW